MHSTHQALMSKFCFNIDKKKRDHETKVAEMKGLELSLAQKRSEHDSLKEKRHKQFREGFDLIANHVK